MTSRASRAVPERASNASSKRLRGVSTALIGLMLAAAPLDPTLSTSGASLLPQAAAEARLSPNAERARNRAVQSELARLGYDVGEIDGIWGPRSTAQLRAFQRDQDLPITGAPSAEILALMQALGGANEAAQDGASAASVGGDAPDALRGRLVWSYAWNNKSRDGLCAFKWPRTDATQAETSYVGDAICEGDEYDYDIRLDPSSGRISGEIRVRTPETATSRVPLSGVWPEAGGRQRGATIALAFE